MLWIDEPLQQRMNDLAELERVARIGTWRLDLATDMVILSGELCRNFNLGPAIPPLRYHEHRKMFCEESWHLLQVAQERLISDAAPYELELETVNSDGSHGWIWISAKPECDSEGNIVSVWGATREITAQKQAEKALSESEERYRRLFHYAGIGIVYYSLDEVLISCNQKALELIRSKSEDIIGHSIREIFQEREAALLHRIIHETRYSDKALQYEDKIQFGSFFKWLSSVSTRMTNTNGEVIGVQVASIDVTEQRETEEKIRKHNEVITSLLKLLPVGVFMVDAEDGKPLIANDVGMQLLGSGILPDADEHNPPEIYKTYQKGTSQEYPNEAMPITLGRNGVRAHIEDMIVKRPDGTRRLLEVFGSPVVDDDGEPWASLVTIMDITERKKAEEELIYLSYHDELTGFYNRRFFENELIRLDASAVMPLSIIITFSQTGQKLRNARKRHSFF